MAHNKHRLVWMGGVRKRSLHGGDLYEIYELQLESAILAMAPIREGTGEGRDQRGPTQRQQSANVGREGKESWWSSITALAPPAPPPPRRPARPSPPPLLLLLPLICPSHRNETDQADVSPTNQAVAEWAVGNEAMGREEEKKKLQFRLCSKLNALEYQARINVCCG